MSVMLVSLTEAVIRFRSRRRDGGNQAQFVTRLGTSRPADG